MTNSEAAKYIEHIRFYMVGGECWTDAEFEAMDMAIEALRSATDINVATSKYTVSATAVEEMLKDLLPERGMWEIEGDEAKNAICETVHDALEGLWKLPSAQPERKREKWIDYTEDGYVECPFCHSATNCDGNKDELHFCFSCGADMRGEQDE